MKADSLRPLRLVVLALFVTGCADKTIQLSYAPDAMTTKLDRAQPLTVFEFRDVRGEEGDNDPYRVGGVYDGYGSRKSKVIAQMSWQRVLVRALASGFRARGVEVIAVEDRQFTTGLAISTPLALGGEIRHFSAESRWSTVAHIAGITRLHGANGTIVVEKMISERYTWGLGAGPNILGGGLWAAGPLETALNRALQGFVRKVVSDPDVVASLTSHAAAR